MTTTRLPTGIHDLESVRNRAALRNSPMERPTLIKLRSKRLSD